MTIQDAIELFEKHQKSTVKKSTIKSYGKFLVKVQKRFLGREVVSVSPDEISTFLEECTGTLSRVRFDKLNAAISSKNFGLIFLPDISMLIRNTKENKY